MQVLPFVLLGLGVDDSFVICNGFGRTDPRKSVPDRMAEGLGTSGLYLITLIYCFVNNVVSLCLGIQSRIRLRSHSVPEVLVSLMVLLMVLMMPLLFCIGARNGAVFMMPYVFLVLFLTPQTLPIPFILWLTALVLH